MDDIHSVKLKQKHLENMRFVHDKNEWTQGNVTLIQKTPLTFVLKENNEKIKFLYLLIDKLLEKNALHLYNEKIK